MTTFKKTVSSALAVLTVGASLAASAGAAEARGYRGGAIAAGVIGGLALGAMAAHAADARPVTVVERRTVRKHRCGCVHHYHHYRY